MAPTGILFSLAAYRVAGPETTYRLIQKNDLSSFNFLLRKKGEEILVFCARTIATRIELGSTVSVQYEENFCHVVSTKDGLVTCAITDGDYPVKSAFAAVRRFQAELIGAHGDRWRSVTADVTDDSFSYPAFANTFNECKDPRTVSKTAKIQADLDEIVDQMNTNFNSLLKRDEDLNQLAQKSSDLSDASRTFVSMARKTNRCRCSVM